MSLVDVESLENMLGLSFDAQQYKRAQMLLELASGEVEAFCDAVTLKRVDNDVVYLRGSWGNMLKLPGGPVHAVHSIDVDGEAIDDFDWARHGILINPLRWSGQEASVRVVYDHGLDVVPQVVRSVILSRAVRAFTNPEQVMQAKMGADRSVSYSADVEMISGLNKSERLALRRFRRTWA